MVTEGETVVSALSFISSTHFGSSRPGFTGTLCDTMNHQFYSQESLTTVGKWNGEALAQGNQGEEDRCKLQQPLSIVTSVVLQSLFWKGSHVKEQCRKCWVLVPAPWTCSVMLGCKKSRSCDPGVQGSQDTK